jgi:nucleotide-binding universal stress UspA family protein
VTPSTTLTFGDDRSPHSDTTWAWIDSHRWTGWRLAVVTAVATVVPPIQAEQAVLRRWEPDHPRVPSPDTDFLAVEHLTTELDPRLALSAPTGLLVIGPRGPGLLKALHLGSTAEWLVHHPPAPMVVARSGGTVREVLVGHDGSAHADEVVGALVRLPWSGLVHVTVLAVQDGRIDTEAALSRTVDSLTAADVTVDGVVRAGHPTEIILDEAARVGADLVALGTRGLTGLHRLRVGSTAAAVSRAAECSVMLACQDQADQPPPAS